MVASPEGWHTLEGKPTKNTAGNNVNAYKGIDKNQLPVNIPIISNSPCVLPSPPLMCIKLGIDSLTTQQTPESSSPDNYIYPYVPQKAPSELQNVHAATVNAFYVANMIHDIAVSFFPHLFLFCKSDIYATLSVYLWLQ